MQKIVVKIGSNVLTKENGQLDTSVIAGIVEQIAILKKEISFGGNNTIFFHLDNELESSIFDNIKLKLINYINSKFIEKIEIEKKVNLIEKQKTIYTNQDKYEFLIKKNKNLIELKNKLGLDYEY